MADRILTTHGGRLQRPEALTDAMNDDPKGRPSDDAAFANALRESVADTVREQRRDGVDIVNDGEFGKISWNAYLAGRLGGFERVGPPRSPMAGRDREAFPGFYREELPPERRYYRSPGRDDSSGPTWVCTGPVTYVGGDALREDVDNLTAALSDSDAPAGFMTSTAPGSVTWANRHYGSDVDYLTALADAMRVEYRTITDAGLTVQIDDPLLPTVWDRLAPGSDIEQYYEHCELRIDALNRALEGVPTEQVRLHICWGSWHGPHSTDVELRTVVPLLRKMNVGAYVFEAGNVRHEHEWDVWKDVDLGDTRLVPGVVSHATNVIEHPELVARRLLQFATVVDKERLIAGTDCGLGYRVHPEIAAAKLRVLAEGARRASDQLW